MILKTLGSPTEESWPGALAGGGRDGARLVLVHESPPKGLVHVLHCTLLTTLNPAAGLGKLPNARKFNLGKHPAGNLRQRFPPAGLGFDGRPSLSEQGFHLLGSLLELCPVRCALVVV